MMMTGLDDYESVILWSTGFNDDIVMTGLDDDAGLDGYESVRLWGTGFDDEIVMTQG
jgi:hypothetical protein